MDDLISFIHAADDEVMRSSSRRPQRYLLGNVLGDLVYGEPVVCPEMQAYVHHLMLQNKTTIDDLPEGSIDWLTMPRKLDMELYYKTYKLTLRQWKILNREVTRFIEFRLARLGPDAGTDKMFDPSRGKIVELPAGTVHDLIVEADGSHTLRPATYWSKTIGG